MKSTDLEREWGRQRAYGSTRRTAPLAPPPRQATPLFGKPRPHISTTHFTRFCRRPFLSPLGRRPPPPCVAGRGGAARGGWEDGGGFPAAGPLLLPLLFGRDRSPFARESEEARVRPRRGRGNRRAALGRAEPRGTGTWG